MKLWVVMKLVRWEGCKVLNQSFSDLGPLVNVQGSVGCLLVYDTKDEAEKNAKGLQVLEIEVERRNQL